MVLRETAIISKQLYHRLWEILTRNQPPRGCIFSLNFLVQRKDNGEYNGQESGIKEASFAKLFATEAASSIINESVQIHGGAGLEKGARIERLYRAVRALTIYEGTSEIQRQTIARQLLRE